MSQPEWKFIANLGDVNPVDHGGYFVFEDETGVYSPEAELLETWDDGDQEKWEAYRFCLDRCTYIDGILSDNEYHPDHPAWFADTLDSIANCMGMDTSVLINLLCSEDARELAEGYRCIGMYHGFDNFDSYPLQFDNREEVEERYEGEKYTC